MRKYRDDMILASASPRRREMFAEKGIDVRIVPAQVDEELPMDTDPQSQVMYLALKKAMWVAEKLNLDADGASAAGQGMVIAADTVVVFDGEVIGKPADENEAYRVLSAMRNNVNTVITGVCIIDPACSGGQSEKGRTAASIRCLCERTDVYFGDYSDEELRAYLKTPEPYDKAGGYAIQGSFGKHIDRIDGDRDNVIGFPMYRVEEYLVRGAAEK